MEDLIYLIIISISFILSLLLLIMLYINITFRNKIKSYNFDVLRVNLEYNPQKKISEYYIKVNNKLQYALINKDVLMSIEYDKDKDTKHSILCFIDSSKSILLYTIKFEHLDREEYKYYIPKHLQILLNGKIIIYTSEKYKYEKIEITTNKIKNVKQPSKLSIETIDNKEKTIDNKTKNIIVYDNEEFNKIINTYRPSTTICSYRTLFISTKDFPYKQEIIKWLTSYCFNYWDVNIYVKSNGTIDIISINSKKLGYVQVFVKNQGRLPKFIKFNKGDCNFRFMSTPYEDHLWRCSYYNDYIHRPYCRDLLDLSGSPKQITGNFEVWDCGLKSMVGGPIIVKGDFSVSKNKLSSFFGMPKYIGGVFDIRNNEFTDESFEEFLKSDESENVEINNYKHEKNLFIKYKKQLFI